MIKIELNKGVGSVEMEGTVKTVTCELATMFEVLAKNYEEVFLAALKLFEIERDNNED